MDTFFQNIWINAFVEELRYYTCRISDQLDDATRLYIPCDIGRLVVDLVTRIEKFIVLHGSRNVFLSKIVLLYFHNNFVISGLVNFISY